MPVEITQSELSSLGLCPYQWNLKYNECLRPKRKNIKLAVGSAVHAGVEAFYKRDPDPMKVVQDYCQKVLDEADAAGLHVDEEYEVSLAKATSLMRAYLKKYSHDHDVYNILAVEAQFRVHLVDDIFIVGKIDRTMIEKDTGAFLPTETKTAAQFDADVNKLMLDFQVSVYAWAFMKQLGLRYVNVLYDVILKPMLRQKKDESVEQYLARIEEAITEDPTRYFVRTKVHRSHDELRRTEEELVIRCRELVRRRESREVYRISGDHCNWRCDYRKLCLEPTADMEELYSRVENPHQELVPEEERQA